MDRTRSAPMKPHPARRTGRFPIVLCTAVLLALLILSVLTSITFGPADIAVPDVARILFCKLFRQEPAQYAELLYDQALLIAGLPIDDPVAYAQLVCGLMK